MDEEKKVVSLSVEFHTAWEFEGMEDEEARQKAFELVKEYLTSRQSVFFGDYGKQAWGGWSGPFVIKSDVIRLGIPSSEGDS